MTPFLIEHEFRAPSLELYWRVYFDDSHFANLDAQTGVEERRLVERREDDDIVYRSLELRPKRQLPGWLRKLIKKDLGYTQNETFHKRDNRIEIQIVPTIFPGRSEINSTYSVDVVAPGRLRRRFEGTISIRVPFGKRIEKAILEDMIRSYEVGVRVTQERLDHEAGVA